MARSTTDPAPLRILFVCLGNICRSPLAEGIARHLAGGAPSPIHVDSAGTGGWHIGDPPDGRSIAVARRHGVDISAQAARQVERADFTRFDLILGMDRQNVATLRALAPAGTTARIALFLDHTLGLDEDVPDPYFGGADGFEAVYSQLFKGCGALLAASDGLAS
ncbi:low molecular weight protein-tyrosine-phosphatase [Ensifer soli]|uniref:low molecular weight protein-tyrosine-phosphatase n=1 Tax=Ciceribacter sp. sgz301302 TaxID=3342379 RepID=UPI0035BB048B